MGIMGGVSTVMSIFDKVTGMVSKASFRAGKIGKSLIGNAVGRTFLAAGAVFVMAHNDDGVITNIKNKFKSTISTIGQTIRGVVAGKTIDVIERTDEIVTGMSNVLDQNMEEAIGYDLQDIIDKGRDGWSGTYDDDIMMADAVINESVYDADTETVSTDDTQDISEDFEDMNVADEYQAG